MEGAFFSYVQSPATWVFQEPELLISQFPLCFHESDKVEIGKVTISAIWDKTDIDRDTFIGLSEINAGCGIFDKVEKKELPIQSSIQTSSNSYSDQDFSQVFENEKGQRVSRLFQLIKLQNEHDCEIVIASGAETETKRIQEILKEESLLLGLDQDLSKLV